MNSSVTPRGDVHVALYGIPNCDQVKKARKWLEEHAVPYQFHDFKQDGITTALIKYWLTLTSWDTLINRRGTTWRTVAVAQHPHDDASAIELMRDKPAVIKRPVILWNHQIIIGFSEPIYASLF